jgi:hypothetical protein
VPTTCCDGLNPKRVGAQTYNTYRNDVNTRRAKASPMEIIATHEIVGNTIYFEVDVKNTSASTISNVSINFAAYEDLGTARLHYTTRLFCPYQTITLAAGESRHLSASKTIPTGTNARKLHGVVFAQLRSSATREVLQATTTPFEETPYEPPAGLFNQGWNWFSLPAIPNDPEASAVFEHNMSNRIFMWDKAAKTIGLYPDDFTDLVMGEGYLLYLDDQIYQPHFFGNDAPAWSYIDVPSSGWVWVGYAHEGSTQLSVCRVLNKSLNMAKSAMTDANSMHPWVNWNWLYYDSQARTVKICAMSGGDDTMLRSWYGYMAWANVDNLQLQIPKG